MLVGSKDGFLWRRSTVIDGIHQVLLWMFCHKLLVSIPLGTRTRSSKSHPGSFSLSSIILLVSNDNILSCFLILDTVDHLSYGVSGATHEPSSNILGMLLRLTVKSPARERTARLSNCLIVVGL